MSGFDYAGVRTRLAQYETATWSAARLGVIVDEHERDTSFRRISVGANQTTGFPSDVCARGSAVRRLTPRECERLQGFPDDYTLIPYRKGMAADGPRYKALGNSMAVPVMEWIGRRIDAVDKIERIA